MANEWGTGTNTSSAWTSPTPYSASSYAGDWNNWLASASPDEVSSVMDWAKGYSPYFSATKRGTSAFNNFYGNTGGLADANKVAQWALQKDWVTGQQAGTAAQQLGNYVGKLQNMYPGTIDETGNNLNDYYQSRSQLASYMDPHVQSGSQGQRYTYADASGFVPVLGAKWDNAAVNMGWATPSGGKLVPTALGNQVGWYQGWNPGTNGPVSLTDLHIQQPTPQAVSIPSQPAATQPINVSGPQTLAQAVTGQVATAPTQQVTQQQSAGVCPTCGRAL